MGPHTNTQLEELALSAAVKVIKDVNEGREKLSRHFWGFGEDPYDLIVHLRSKKYICFRHYGSRTPLVSEVVVSTHVLVRRRWDSPGELWEPIDKTIAEGDAWEQIFESFPRSKDYREGTNHGKSQSESQEPTES